MSGISGYNIANTLNREGIPSPAEYKKLNGVNFKSAFQKGLKASWSNLAVQRILSNEVYIGVLEQGKYTTINYKVHTKVKKNEDEWIRVQDAHDPIIDKETFEIIQRILKTDMELLQIKKKNIFFLA